MIFTIGLAQQSGMVAPLKLFQDTSPSIEMNDQKKF